MNQTFKKGGYSEVATEKKKFKIRQVARTLVRDGQEPRKKETSSL